MSFFKLVHLRVAGKSGRVSGRPEKQGGGRGIKDAAIMNGIRQGGWGLRGTRPAGGVKLERKGKRGSSEKAQDGSHAEYNVTRQRIRRAR